MMKAIRWCSDLIEHLKMQKCEIVGNFILQLLDVGVVGQLIGWLGLRIEIDLACQKRHQGCTNSEVCHMWSAKPKSSSLIAVTEC